MPSPRSVAIEIARAHHPEGERLHEDAADQVLAVVAAGHAITPPKTKANSSTNISGCSVTSSSFSGIWRTCCEVAAGEREAVGHEPARALRGADGAGRRGVMRPPPRSRAARGGEGEEDVVERGLAAVDVARVDAGGVERADDLDSRVPGRARDRDDGASGVGRGGPSANGAQRGGGRVERRPAPATRDHDPLAADRALSSAGEPGATTRPWSSTTMSSASRSASSRYCVVSSSVVPSRDELAQQLPELVAALRVEAGGRLVEEQDRRGGDEARREIEPAPHAAGVRLDEPVGGVGEPEALEQLVGARRATARGQVVEAADHLEVRARASAGRRPSRPGRRRRCGRAPRRLGDHVVAGDARACPSVGRASVVRMRIAVVLPAPLWPSRPSTVPGGDVEVDVAERPEVAVALAEALGAMPPWRSSYAVRFFVHRTTKLAVHCTNVKAAGGRLDLGASRAGRAAAALHARADRRGRDRDRRRRGLRGGVDAPRSRRSSAPGR